MAAAAGEATLQEQRLGPLVLQLPTLVFVELHLTVRLITHSFTFCLGEYTYVQQTVDDVSNAIMINSLLELLLFRRSSLPPRIQADPARRQALF